MPYLNSKMEVIDNIESCYSNYAFNIVLEAYISKEGSRFNCSGVRDRRDVYDIEKGLRIYKELNELELKNSLEVFVDKSIESNNFPYYYDVKYSKDKILIKSKVLHLEIKDKKMSQELLSSGLVFNLRSGKAYLLGIRNKDNELLKYGLRIKNRHLIELTYLNNKEIKSVENFIIIPDNEWVNVENRIMEYNKVNKKSSVRKELDELLRLNRFPFNNISKDDFFRINMRINIRGMKKNVFDYIDRDLIELESSFDCVKFDAVYEILKNYLNLVLKDKEIAELITNVFITCGGKYKFINKRYFRGIIEVPEYVDNWFRLFIKTNGKEKCKESLKKESEYLNEVLQYYKIILEKRIDVKPLEGLKETLDMYKDYMVSYDLMSKL